MKYLFGHSFELGKNRSTSLASIASRVIIRKTEQKVRARVAKVIGGRTARKLFMRAGGALGRIIPGLGWGLTVYDVWENRQVIAVGAETFSAGGADYYKLRSNPSTFYMYAK